MDTTPAGAQVVIDGKPSGTTPVTLILPAGVHTVELHGTGPARTISVNVVAGTEVAQYVELPKGGACARAASGADGAGWCPRDPWTACRAARRRSRSAT